MGNRLEPGARDAARLHPRVVQTLNAIASELAELELELFLFGSVAETYPYARKGADLDLGLRFKADCNLDRQRERKRLAMQRLRELPTVRPVDVVDFDDAKAPFKTLAMARCLKFPLPTNGSDN